MHQETLVMLANGPRRQRFSVYITSCKVWSLTMLNPKSRWPHIYTPKTCGIDYSEHIPKPWELVPVTPNCDNWQCQTWCVLNMWDRTAWDCSPYTALGIASCRVCFGSQTSVPYNHHRNPHLSRNTMLIIARANQRIS